MKLTLYLLCAALVAIVALTSINCVQNTTTPQPSPSPAAPATPGPLPANNLTSAQKLELYNQAIADPYVYDRIAKTAWRSMRQVGDQLIVSTNFTIGDVAYMRCHEIGPGYDRWRILPAAEIVPGSTSRAGVNLIAFIDAGRVAYIGFVPRTGAPVDNFTYASVDARVDEYDRAGDVHHYYDNVTIVDTGYIKGMSLSPAQVDQAIALAMTNATTRGYFGGHGINTRNISVYSYETGYPYRYILAYPVVTIDVTDGATVYDTVYVFTDLVHDRVVRVEHGLELKP